MATKETWVHQFLLLCHYLKKEFEMKIATIATLKTGGAGIAAFRLHLPLSQKEGIEANFLQKMYEGVDPIAKVNYVPERSSLFYRFQRKLCLTPECKNSRQIQMYPSNGEYEIASFPTSSYRIEDHPLVKEADIIHLHWVANFLNYPTFFKKIKQPIVWTLHDMNAFQGVFHYQNDIIRNAELYADLEAKTRKEKENFISQHPNIHIVTPSHWLAKLSQESDAFKRYDHSVIPYGIKVDLVEEINEVQIKAQLSINNDYPILLFIAHGLDIYRKGFDLLLQAIENINSSPVNLVSVGGDKTIVNNSNVNHIHFSNITDRSKLNRIYSIADITILPSREDNLPNVMIESLTNGTPVLSFTNGGMAEHIITGKNGILVDNIDADSLKIAIEDFLNCNYTFDRKAIKESALKVFDEKQQVERYINLYKQILNK